MALNLNYCTGVCVDCIKGYKGKHTLRKGEQFKIKCNGITKPEIQLEMLSSLSKEEQGTALSVLDPVAWAAENLDWHCLDPDGEIWKRKNPTEYWEWIDANPGIDIFGHSRYHRPYQAIMLRCTARSKVFRIGRQAGKTETIVVSMLYHLFTKPGAPGGFTIIVITPYQAQIDLIFSRMKELIRSSPLTQNSVRRDVKAPIYSIELHNDSIVKGFTAGTKSGGNAEAVRGQHGHMLVFDEADYLNSGDMDAALSIITNFPTASVWMSSTPSGKRAKFYDTCNSTIFKEFFYPSDVNPLWSEEKETLFKEQLTEIGYKHEILAEFGEQEEGVFQNCYVQAAKANYKYGSYSYDHTWSYTIGVDWNDTANGTTIAVVGFNPHIRKFILVDRVTVSRDGWTQLAACEKIMEWNRIWRPISIYIDAGHGGTQWEVLRKGSFDASRDPTRGPTHPDARVKDILKKYDFGSNIETRDLWTKQPVLKPAKPFLVEATVRRFEANDFQFPEDDEVLEKQLLGYIIDRITPAGRPVYKPGDETAGDHVLDSLMLAMIAFTLEVSPLGKVSYSSHIAFSGNFGEKGTEIHEGDLVIVNKSNKENNRSIAEKQKPDGRSGNVFGNNDLFSQTSLPANNLNQGVKPGLWSWPGFNRDAPRPQIKSPTNKRRGGRPTRKNI